MKNWTIGKRILTTCAVLVALAGATGTVGILGIHKVGAELNSLATDSMPGVLDLARVEAAALEIRGSSHLLALPGLTSYKARQLARVGELEKEIPAILQDYSQFAFSEERPLYEKAKGSSDAFLTTCAKYRQLINDGKLQEASDFWQQSGIAKWSALKRNLDAEIEFNKQGAKAHIRAGISASNTATLLTGCLLALAVGVGCLFGILTTANVSRALRRSADELRSSAEHIVTAATQVAAASEQLAQGANEQSASLEETSASSQQVTAMTQQNAENSGAAATLMVHVDDNVSQANAKLEQLVISMGEISGSSERIAKIIKVIDEIAFQTNILALNAAVEAARAGEAGMGFAVVADEVRNLAQRCAEAAKNTTLLIEESVANAQSGSNRLTSVAEAIRGITENAAQVKILVDEVKHGGKEQAHGMARISAALTQMETMTQQTAAGAEEGASASQELKAQADSMQEVVIVLEALVSSSNVKRRSRNLTRPALRKFPAQATSKQGLLSLQRAVGTSRRPKTQEPSQLVTVGKDEFIFPLDDAEFREF